MKYYRDIDRLKTKSSQLSRFVFVDFTLKDILISDSLELEEIGEQGQKGPHQYFAFGQKGRGGTQRQVRKQKQLDA